MEPMPRESRYVRVAGPVGQTEALLYEPEQGPPRFTAIVCHPHPLFGGTMHNHATVRLARVLADHGGGIAVRFNFRGVGRSAGVHAEGRGEIDDARAVLARLRVDWPEAPRWSTGFSFGARVALAAGASGPDVQRVA